jgi:hypothetical protein
MSLIRLLSLGTLCACASVNPAPPNADPAQADLGNATPVALVVQNDGITDIALSRCRLGDCVRLATVRPLATETVMIPYTALADGDSNLLLRQIGGDGEITMPIGQVNSDDRVVLRVENELTQSALYTERARRSE